MKPAKKSRVQYVSYKTFRTRCAEYVQPVPYDKRQREIPSSVNTAYNLEYVTIPAALQSLNTM